MEVRLRCAEPREVARRRRDGGDRAARRALEPEEEQAATSSEERDRMERIRDRRTGGERRYGPRGRRRRAPSPTSPHRLDARGGGRPAIVLRLGVAAPLGPGLERPSAARPRRSIAPGRTGRPPPPPARRTARARCRRGADDRAALRGCSTRPQPAASVVPAPWTRAGLSHASRSSSGSGSRRCQPARGRARPAPRPDGPRAAALRAAACAGARARRRRHRPRGGGGNLVRGGAARASARAYATKETLTFIGLGPGRVTVRLRLSAGDEFLLDLDVTSEPIALPRPGARRAAHPPARERHRGRGGDPLRPRDEEQRRRPPHRGRRACLHRARVADDARRDLEGDGDRRRGRRAPPLSARAPPGLDRLVRGRYLRSSRGPSGTMAGRVHGGLRSVVVQAC